jgi:hypothetical protein
MATPGADDTIHEVVVHMRQQQQEVLNVWHFFNDTPVDDMELRLLRALLECYLTVLLPASGSLLTVERVTGMQVGPTLGPMYEITPDEGDTVAGAAAGDTLPTHDSLSIRIHSARPGRSGRGRKQLPGVPEGATVGSTITTGGAYWTAVLAFLVCVGNKFIHGNELSGANTISLGVLAKTLKPLDVNGKRKAPWPVDLFSHALRLSATPKVGTTNSRKVGRGS